MAEEALRIVQLNAGSLLEPGWDERRHEIVAWLERLDPDVICLQEIWQSDGTGNTAGWLVDQAEAGRWYWTFGGGTVRPPFVEDPSTVFGSAILSRWPIDDHHHWDLPLAPDPEEVVTLLPWELLHAETAGLDVFSAHLAPAPHHGDHRIAQVLAIDDHVRAVRGDKDVLVPGRRRSAMPPIVCGDFNAEPDSDEMRFLCSLTMLDGRSTFYQDAWRVAGEGPGYTQDWRGNRIAASLNVHRKRIDYVLVGDPFLRRGSAGRVLSAALAFDEPLTGVLASDHAGLVVEVTWPSRPPVPALPGASDVRPSDS
jgi:endonuclease/exonuclease/phosphatase family metal-dependent hydrolase